MTKTVDVINIIWCGDKYMWWKNCEHHLSKNAFFPKQLKQNENLFDAHKINMWTIMA